MGFTDTPAYPDDHPISPTQAHTLLAGDLGCVYRNILREACSPIYWHSEHPEGGRRIVANGTITYAKLGRKTFGITAAHVVDAYKKDADASACILQIGDTTYPLDVAAIDEPEDIAILRIPESIINSVGKTITSLPIVGTGQVPQEGRGVMFAGFPGEDWFEWRRQNICWGLFTALGIARRVSDSQITWAPDHEHNVPVPGIPNMPRHKDLGGISGGPFVAWFERAGLSFAALAGIVVQANAGLENVVARRLDTPRVSAMLSRLS